MKHSLSNEVQVILATGRIPILRKHTTHPPPHTNRPYTTNVSPELTYHTPITYITHTTHIYTYPSTSTHTYTHNQSVIFSPSVTVQYCISSGPSQFLFRLIQFYYCLFSVHGVVTYLYSNHFCKIKFSQDISLFFQCFYSCCCFVFVFLLVFIMFSLFVCIFVRECVCLCMHQDIHTERPKDKLTKRGSLFLLHHS